MSICLNPNQWSRRYRHGDMVNDRNAEYQATVYDVLPHSLSRYLSITQGCGYVVIMKPHGSGYKLVGEVKRNQQCPRINYHRDEIRVPISNGYPVVTIDYAVLPVDVFDHSDRYIVTPYISARTPIAEPSIPHRIYQTFETLIIPQKLKPCIDTWLETYPEFSYHYVTGLESEKFIANNFEPRVLKAYQSIFPGAYKADFWRICQLYITGGIYADVKMYSVKSLLPLIDDNDLILVIDLVPSGIYNAFMASKPRHPLLKMIIDKMIDNIESHYYAIGEIDPPLQITGPFLLGKCLTQYFGYLPSQRGLLIHDDGSKLYILDHKLLNVEINHRSISDGDTNYLYARHPIDHMSNEEYYSITGKLHYNDVYHKHRIYADENL
jgi:hypothetical protein